MVNILKAVSGTAAFIIAYFLMSILQYIAPPITDIVQTAFGDTIASIVWFGYILINGIACIIVPAALIYNAVTEPEEETNPILKTTIAALYCLFSIAIIYFTYYTIDTMVTSLQYDLLKAFFWAGLIIVWVSNVIAIPTYMVISARKS